MYNKSLIKTKEFEEAEKNPTIIHFCESLPILSNCKHPMNELWWEYAKKAPFKMEKFNLYKLSATSAKNSFRYGWLLSRIAPYLKPYWFRILLGFAISILGSFAVFSIFFPLTETPVREFVSATTQPVLRFEITA